MPTNRSLTTRRDPRGPFKSVQQIAGQNNPRTGALNPRRQDPEGTEAALLAMELADTVRAADLLPGARIRGGDGYACTVVNREINGNVIVRREVDGEWATLRPSDRVVRTARSKMRDFLPPAMVRKNRFYFAPNLPLFTACCWVFFSVLRFSRTTIQHSMTHLNTLTE